MVNSSFYQDGQFVLLLDNPVTGGSYTCHIPENEAGAACLHDNQVAGNNIVVVDEVKVRFSILEAQQASLVAENSRLQSQLSAVVANNNRLEEQLERQGRDHEQKLAKIQGLYSPSAHLTKNLRLMKSSALGAMTASALGAMTASALGAMTASALRLGKVKGGKGDCSFNPHNLDVAHHIIKQFSKSLLRHIRPWNVKVMVAFPGEHFHQILLQLNKPTCMHGNAL